MPEGGDTIDLPIRRGQMQDRGLAETGPPRSLGGGRIADLENFCSLQPAGRLDLWQSTDQRTATVSTGHDSAKGHRPAAVEAGITKHLGWHLI